MGAPFPSGVRPGRICDSQISPSEAMPEWWRGATIFQINTCTIPTATTSNFPRASIGQNPAVMPPPAARAMARADSFPVLWHFAENNPGVGCGCLLGCLAGLGRVLGGVPVGGPAVPAPMRASAIPRHLLETGPRNGAPSTASFATFLGFCGDVGIWFVVQAALLVVALDLSFVIPGPP